MKVLKSLTKKVMLKKFWLLGKQIVIKFGQLARLISVRDWYKLKGCLAMSYVFTYLIFLNLSDSYSLTSIIDSNPVLKLIKNAIELLIFFFGLKGMVLLIINP